MADVKQHHAWGEGISSVVAVLANIDFNKKLSNHRTNKNSSGNISLDVLEIALNQATRKPGKMSTTWYISTTSLQLACVQTCIACRNVVSAHVRVDYGTPQSLLRLPEEEDEEPPSMTTIPCTPECIPCASTENFTTSKNAEKCRYGLELKTRSRVPVLRIRTVTWQQSPETLKDCELLRDVECITFDAYGYDDLLDHVIWPPNLRKLVLGGTFSRAIDHLSWPPKLKELVFRGEGFNQSIDRARWPATLQRLTFGSGFNKPIGKVVWPPSLRHLTFGHDFNQAIKHVTWRAAYSSLTHLTFGNDFNQPINSEVRWPASLQCAVFGDSFDQEISRVIWPATLRSLIFGTRFNRPVVAVTWPATLRDVAFGRCFAQAMDKVVWPKSLEHLTFLCTDPRFIESLKTGCRWPAGLRKLTLGTCVDLEFGFLPEHMEILRAQKKDLYDVQ